MSSTSSTTVQTQVLSGRGRPTAYEWSQLASPQVSPPWHSHPQRAPAPFTRLPTSTPFSQHTSLAGIGRGVGRGIGRGISSAPGLSTIGFASDYHQRETTFADRHLPVREPRTSRRSLYSEEESDVQRAIYNSTRPAWSEYRDDQWETRSNASNRRTSQWVDEQNRSHYGGSLMKVSSDHNFDDQFSSVSQTRAYYSAPHRDRKHEYDRPAHRESAVNEHVTGLDNKTATKTPANLPAFAREVKLKPYGGDSDVDYFISQFCMAARLGNWPVERQGEILGTLLIGKARRLLPRDPDAPTPSFKELSRKLRSHFGAEGEPDYFQVLLDSCSREKKESINDLKGRIIELVDKAYPSVSIDERKKLYVGPFIRALSDEGQRQAVRMSRPKTLEQAAESAIVFESHVRSEETGYTKMKKTPVRAVSYGAQQETSGVQKNSKQARTKTPAPATIQPQQTTESQADMISAITASVMEQMTALLQRPTESGNQRGTRFPRLCYHCQKPGHFKRSCPELRNNNVTVDQNSENASGRDSTGPSLGQDASQ
jgi:hypothetical protein